MAVALHSHVRRRTIEISPVRGRANHEEKNMSELKDWTTHIAGLAEMDVAALTNLYSEMLATAHDIDYKVPDELLVETEDPEELRNVIEPLHDGLKKFHAEAAKKPASAKEKAKTVKAKAPKKPAAVAKQKAAKETKMTETATAKKAAAPKKAAAKKTAKKAAPAKKAAAKTAKKASAANARTPAGRWTGDEVITVKVKENPARAGSGKFDRMANLLKFNGKKVKDFLKTSLGRSSTLHNAQKAGYISIK
jgi:outer membrane biosynthesis protein TonB